MPLCMVFLLVLYFSDYQRAASIILAAYLICLQVYRRYLMQYCVVNDQEFTCAIDFCQKCLVMTVVCFRSIAIKLSAFLVQLHIFHCMLSSES